MSDYFARVTQALRFWSRLPIRIGEPRVSHPGMDALATAVPAAGAIIGALGGLVLVAAGATGLPPWPAAILAVAALVLVTGALHEDALADVADGFGGGATPERRLAIMRDPHLGSFGATALVLAVALKAGLLGALADEAGFWHAALALAGASALSRVAGLWPLLALPPARSDGLGHAAAGLSALRWRVAAMVGALMALLLAWPAAGPAAGLVGLLLAAVAVGAITALARRLIGGQTGDVCGAATLVAELGFLAAVTASGG